MRALSFGLGGSISMDGALLARADTNVLIEQGSVKNLVLFELRPWTYHVVPVRGSFRSGNFWHNLVAEVDSVVGPISVAAGQITSVAFEIQYGADGRGGVNSGVRPQ